MSRTRFRLFVQIGARAGTISTNAGKIVKASEKAQADLEDQVKTLNNNVAALKALVMGKSTRDETEDLAARLPSN